MTIYRNQYDEKKIYSFFKRIIDIVAAFLGILILSWLFLLIALIIKLTSKGKVIYKQRRVGKNGVMFNIYKFRSMKDDKRKLVDVLTEEEYKEYLVNYKIENDPRVTTFGKIIRKTSLDELPQLFNVLKGDISLVGPRPILYEESLRYKENREVLLKVRPGLTGYWAVNGRSDTTYEERMKMELYYIYHRNFLLDFKILLKTITAVIKGTGAR